MNVTVKLGVAVKAELYKQFLTVIDGYKHHLKRAENHPSGDFNLYFLDATFPSETEATRYLLETRDYIYTGVFADNEDLYGYIIPAEETKPSWIFCKTGLFKQL